MKTPLHARRVQDGAAAYAAAILVNDEMRAHRARCAAGADFLESRAVYTAELDAAERAGKGGGAP